MEYTGTSIIMLMEIIDSLCEVAIDLAEIIDSLCEADRLKEVHFN